MTLKKPAKWIGALLLAAAFVVACAAPYVWTTGETDDQPAVDSNQSQLDDDSQSSDGDDASSEGAVGTGGDGSDGEIASDDGDEDVVNEDDYESAEDYAMAIAKSIMQTEADVPEEWVDDGVHENKYLAGTLNISFEGSVSKSEAASIVENYGGTWVSGTFMTGVDAGFNRATAYFEEYADATYAELEALCDEIAHEDGVRGASVKEKNNAVEEVETNDPDASS